MRLLWVAAAWAALALPAHAEVAAAEPASFTIEQSHEFANPAKEVWRAVGRPQDWWDGDHTYSGDSANMRLNLRPGGCFCEQWKGSFVEHGRVVLAMPEQMLRIDGALGPLQEMAVTGVLTYAIAEENGRARLTMTYRVSGAAGDKLDELAPLVDQVMGGQFARLARFIEMGAPE